jgi:hypothetical protein
MSQQFHAWSHMKKSELPGVVVALQGGGGGGGGGQGLAAAAPARAGGGGGAAAAAVAVAGACSSHALDRRGCNSGVHSSSRPRPADASKPLLQTTAATQDAGLLIGRRAHGAHHRPNFEGNYCIVSGWWNEPLDNSGFFRCDLGLNSVFLLCVGADDQSCRPQRAGSGARTSRRGATPPRPAFLASPASARRTPRSLLPNQVAGEGGREGHRRGAPLLVPPGAWLGGADATRRGARCGRVSGARRAAAARPPPAAGGLPAVAPRRGAGAPAPAPARVRGAAPRRMYFPPRRNALPPPVPARCNPPLPGTNAPPAPQFGFPVAALPPLCPFQACARALGRATEGPGTF